MSASDNMLVKLANVSRMSRDDLPKLGQWYWVKLEDRDAIEEAEDGDEKRYKMKEHLMCAAHIGSNHTCFERHNGEYTYSAHVMHWNVLEFTRPAPEWKEIIQQESDAKQLQLRQAVMKLADMCVKTNLIEDEHAPKVETMLPAVTRADPTHYKKSLVKLKTKDFPAQQKSVERITKELVGLQKDLFLGQHAEFNKLKAIVEGVDDRLFALELYAGFHESAVKILNGEPAPMETPITVRQMIRYMDEETLIDVQDGGMDFSKLDEFDEWVVKPENLNRVAPELRCVVAFRVRRELKDYGVPESIGHALAMIHWHEANMQTYLLIRNGSLVHRISTEVDFHPRLLPLRDELDQPLYKDHYWSREEKVPVTPDMVDYDKCMAARMKTVMHYNRITFLLQGLLDRSPCFHPHPPIALNDPAAVEQWLKLKYDEEDGLPSANPPVWKDYREAANQKLKKGTIIWGWYEHSEYGRHTDWKQIDRKHSGYYRVESVSRDGHTVTISEPWGTRWGYQHSDGYGGYYGKWGEWKVNKRRHHKSVPIDQVFNCDSYVKGDYKTFLCDAYLKGAYLRWAPFLLKAEHYHKMTAEEKAEL